MLTQDLVLAVGNLSSCMPSSGTTQLFRLKEDFKSHQIQPWLDTGGHKHEIHWKRDI